MTCRREGAREAQLHNHWQRAGGRTLHDDSGQPYVVQHPGRLNSGTGPDFLHAVIVFPDGVLRKGDIEIHKTEREWYHHGHHFDENYRHVMLHVVGQADRHNVTHMAEHQIPTLVFPFRGLPDDSPCISVAYGPERAYLEPWLKDMGWERWLGMVKQIRGACQEQVLHSLCRRMGQFPFSQRLPALWIYNALEGHDQATFIDHILLDLRSAGYELPEGWRLERLKWVSALANSMLTQPGSLVDLAGKGKVSLKHLRTLLSLPVPKAFAIECVGNVLLPLMARQGKEEALFEAWYELPLSWTYGRIKAFAARLRLPQPKSFGTQQALLQWMESLCYEGACTACPVMT